MAAGSVKTLPKQWGKIWPKKSKQLLDLNKKYITGNENSQSAPN